MYDSFLVIKDSLKNDEVNGDVVGFSFAARISNYRGLYLSLFSGFYVEMDGVEYQREAQSLEIHGEAPRSMEEIAKAVWEHWDMEDIGIVHIAKKDGLAPGEHTLKYLECSLWTYGYGAGEKEWIKELPKLGSPMTGGKTFSPQTFKFVLKGGK
jgi:hypothetical protein